MKKVILVLVMVLTLLVIMGNKLFSNDSDYFNDNTKLYMNLFDKEELTNTFYQFEPSVRKSVILLKKNIDDYTSFIYSHLNHKLYFVDAAGDKTMQLFSKDLKTNEINQLTHNLGNVDFLQIDKSNSIIFMRVLLRDETRNFHLATFNTLTNELKIWEETEQDISILDYDYSTYNNKMVVVSYSEAESIKKLENANQNQSSLVPSKFSIDIYNINGNKENHITSFEKFITGVTLSPDQKSILISYDESTDKGISHVIEVDIDTKEFKTVMYDTTKPIRDIKYSKNSDGFFYLTYKGNPNNPLDIPEESMLSYFNIESKIHKNLFRTDKDIIVNYSVVED